MTTGEHDATTTTAGAAGEGAGILKGGHAVPGEDLSTPSGTPAGPAPDLEAPTEAPTEAPAEAAAEDVREFATLQWQMPFWEREAGHLERLELTEVIRGAVQNGKLVIVGDVECVKTACKTARKRG